MPRQSTRIQQNLTQDDSAFASSRPRRATAQPRATITRELSDSSEDGTPSLRLTVKMPSSRLRQATSAQDSPEPEIAVASRAKRNQQRKSYVMETDSDDDDEPEEEEDDPEVGISEMDEDPPGASNLEDMDDADGDDDDDVEMGGDDDDDADDGLPLGAPPPAVPATSHTPALKIRGPAAPPSKQPKVTVTPAKDTTLKSVEQKEMELADDDEEDDDDEDDDEELSELVSDDDEEEVELDDEEDAEGVDVDLDDDDSDIDSTRTPGDGTSRASTPDVTKMTKRQRSRLDQVIGADFLQLPMEPQIKKHFTPEEHAMRRAEMARRRKNLSEKRNEEEKADTINRLLKKQAPKRRGKISQAEIEAQDRVDDEEEGIEEKEEEIPANPLFVRWVSNRDGCRVGVPTEWLGKPMGRVFEAPSTRRGGPLGPGRKMVEEVEG